MEKNELTYRTREDLLKELDELKFQLSEANDTIEAIRTGQVDALVVQGGNGHQLYTLKSADHTYRMFIEKMTEGAVTLNREGLILFCNSQFATLVNMPHSKVIGLSFDEFIAPENKEYYSQLFAGCWKADCKGEVLLRSGNNTTPVQLSLNTLDLDEGISLSIILTDLTLQKESQRQLRQNNAQLEDINKALEESNHDLQQFASVASHDLQEPLRKIQIFSNLMQERENMLTPESKKYLSKIIESSGRMKTLIIDILNYSRLSANYLQQECVDLNEMVKELLDDFELIVADKNATFHIDKLPCIDVNRGQIRQVFQNIISNALKFSKKDVAPLITIRYKRIREKSFTAVEQSDGPYCLLRIRDNGIGFDEKYVNNIFALFERLNAKDKYEGTGIGLAIAKKIIDKHNGLITAKSKEDEGSEFCIILPINNQQP
ncbi:MAG TPA: ATP-binding protein [Chitinophagaceae bacterium]|jgi:PAS domain S-box-containing protein|nr:ATP-binding protein [Chitinophagaceae bacterium]